jgi:hypothetical protein
MRKLYVLFGTLLVCAVAGCSEDLNEELVKNTVQILDNTTSDLEQVTKTLNSAVTEAKSSNKPLDIAKIARANQEAGGLKNKARELQDRKARMDVRKDNVTTAEREDYAAKFKPAMAKALQRLDAAEKNLDVALREADAVADNDGKSSLEKLRDTLKEAQNEFEVLTKRQS